MLNRYGEKASFIFLHPLSLKKRQVIRIPNKIAKKLFGVHGDMISDLWILKMIIFLLLI